MMPNRFKLVIAFPVKIAIFQQNIKFSILRVDSIEMADEFRMFFFTINVLMN